MKTYEQISKILVAMSDETFQQIADAVTDYQFNDDMVAKAGAEKALAKHGLTLEEYLEWEAA